MSKTLRNIVRLAFLALAIAAHPLAAERPPNIILILADDVGAETVGVYGGQSYQTPNLDQLASAGIRFNYGHAQPLCTPSRVKIMTGQHNFRNYSHFAYLDPSQTTVGNILSEAGYRTMVVGKWQLYSNPFEDLHGAMPTEAGFEEFLLWQLTSAQKGSRYWGPLLNTNGKIKQYDASEYGPQLFNRYVLDYIEAHSHEPFFIYYPMVLAHDPWVTTPDMRDENASDQQKFAAMIAYMDKMVGNVRSKVEQMGIGKDTLILFIGDNGTDRDIHSMQNGVAVRGAKALTIDAGTRVPFLAWGAGVAGGAVSDSLVNLNDIVPTLAEIAGARLPNDHPGDGESLVSVLSGQSELDRESLFIHYEPRWPSGRSDRYAFNRQYKLYEGGSFYDMLADPLEGRPLDVSDLTGPAQASYLSLRSRIEAMPGELSGPRRWIPLQFYLYLAAFLIALCLLVGLLWRRALRKK